MNILKLKIFDFFEVLYLIIEKIFIANTVFYNHKLVFLNIVFLSVVVGLL